jgi:uncharacterized membrane protein
VENIIYPSFNFYFGWVGNTFLFVRYSLLLFLLLLPFIVIVIVVVVLFFTVIGRPHGFSNGNLAMQDRNVDRDTEEEEVTAGTKEDGAISSFGNTIQVGG